MWSYYYLVNTENIFPQKCVCLMVHSAGFHVQCRGSSLQALLGACVSSVTSLIEICFLSLNGERRKRQWNSWTIISNLRVSYNSKIEIILWREGKTNLFKYPTDSSSFEIFSLCLYSSDYINLDIKRNLSRILFYNNCNSCPFTFMWLAWSWLFCCPHGIKDTHTH